MPQRLAAALRELAERGDVPAGTVLPSQRALAAVLGVSRSTVTAAYGQLEAEGWLASRQGSGSRLRGTPLSRERAGEGRLASFDERRGDALSDVLDLSSGALDGIAAVDAAVDGLSAADLGPLLRSDGYLPYGLPALREALAGYYAQCGTPTTPEQILVTAGSQQAVWLLAQALADPGDTVVTENPTYRGALEALRARGARLVALPDDGTGTPAGAPPDAALLRRVRARLVYLQPTAHNPTGRSLRPAARRAWAELLTRLGEEQGLFTVEDTACAELTLHGDGPPVPLTAQLADDRTATVGTLSKLFWGGLRVGWIRAAPPLVRRLAEVRKSVDLSGPVLDQVLAVRLLARLPAARAQRRGALREQLAAAEALLRERAPGWEWEHPAGGPALWVRMPGADAEAAAQVARRRGVLAVPGPAFSPVDGFRDRVRVPYARDPAMLAEALRVLAESAR
nr:PLP-dependent aminotransferase family protein [Streptomyces boncukensis]